MCGEEPPSSPGAVGRGAQQLGPRAPEAEAVADYQGAPFSAPLHAGLRKESSFSFSLFSLEEGR